MVVHVHVYVHNYMLHIYYEYMMGDHSDVVPMYMYMYGTDLSVSPKSRSKEGGRL